MIPTRKKVTILLLYILFLLVISCSSRSSVKKHTAAVNGILNLEGWDFENDGPVNLDGEWEFYWNRLLEPDDFTNNINQKKTEYITVPGQWEDHNINGKKLPGEGYATYRLKITIGNDKRTKALLLPAVFSACKLWINGELINQKGKVDLTGESRQQFVFLHHKDILIFAPGQGTNEIILQVLNYHFDSGGFSGPVRLGDGKQELRKHNHYSTIAMFVVGALFLIFIYNIFLFIFHKEDNSYLYLGLFSLIWAVNTFDLHSTILYDLFANKRIPYLIDHITNILNLPLVVLIFRSLFPDEFTRFTVRLSLAATVGYLFIMFFTGFKTTELVVQTWYVFCSIYILYALYNFIRILYKGKREALILLIGFFIVFVTAINDMLYGSRIINTLLLTHYGMLVLCFCMTILISRRFARALEEVEELSNDLEAKNITLTKMNQFKDRFLANTSHELRTPLHGMIGMSESMIGSAENLSQKTIDDLSLIASSGHRLANLVNDLLDLAKIQDEGLSLNLKPVDLYSLCEMVVRLSMPLIKGKSLEIINNIEPDIPRVKADEDRIKQVLHNLIGNAVKYSNSGTVIISASVIEPDQETADNTDTERMAEIRVSDTGIGIPEEYREKIFESFQQVDGSDTRSYQGTGLGLAIAKQLIELHSGTIKAESEKNKGSVFIFTLPLWHEQMPEYPGEIIIEDFNEPLSLLTGKEEVGKSMPRVSADMTFEGDPVFLVVDDDPVNVRILQNYLESKNSAVKTAPDGISALEIIEKDGTVDLVLLDIMMPGMSGYEVCERIRAVRSTEQLPVIMVTAKNMISDINRAFEAGANDYIVKPFQVSELFTRISTMLRLKNVQKSAAEGITIRHRNNAYSLRFNDIIYITSKSKKIIIHTRRQDIEFYLAISDIADRLPPDIFLRIHRGYIVNIKYIYNIIHVVSGRYKLRLSDDDDTELPVGPAYLNSLRKKI